jgi:hypothetical protein
VSKATPADRAGTRSDRLRMLGPMWLFPLLAAVVAFAFAAALGRQFFDRRRPYQLVWMLALAMFGLASLAVVAGVASGWSRFTFELYWALGAVLNVPFLAAGEVMLLFRRPAVLWIVGLILIFVTAYTLAVLQGADVVASALGEQLPSGKDVFGDGTAAHRLPQLISIPSYAVLIAGTAWSAWRMRGRPDLRDRFTGTVLIAIGATVVAGGASFSAAGELVGFIATLLVGIAVMFGGFLRAARVRTAVPTVQPEPAT